MSADSSSRRLTGQLHGLSELIRGQHLTHCPPPPSFLWACNTVALKPDFGVENLAPFTYPKCELRLLSLCFLIYIMGVRMVPTSWSCADYNNDICHTQQSLAQGQHRLALLIGSIYIVLSWPQGRRISTQVYNLISFPRTCPEENDIFKEEIGEICFKL